MQTYSEILRKRQLGATAAMREEACGTLVLRDGRQLAYAEFGDPNGAPLIAMHGTPGSRLTFRVADDTAKALGVRIIAPDRPGYGRSSAHPKRSLHDWAKDVAELADSLSIDRFAVTGVSGGGPHALALASLLPERVTSVGLVCPLGPISDEGYDDTVTLGYRVFFRYLARVPGFMRFVFTVGGLGFRFAPLAIYGIVLARATPEDWRILMRHKVRKAISDATCEGLRRSARGGLGDVDVFRKAWDLPLGEIRAPVYLWQGLSDRNVPVRTSLRLGERLPHCSLHSLPRSGHYWVFDNIETVLREVTQGVGIQSDR